VESRVSRPEKDGRLFVLIEIILRGKLL